MKLTMWLMCAGLLIVQGVFAQSSEKKEELKPDEKKKSWYEQISLRGYTQIRYNRLLETNDQLRCDQCDKSWGDNNSVFIRRGRLILFGDVNPHLGIYLQFDFASTPASNSQLHVLQIRDAYFDVNLDTKKVHRIRAGQSKVPFGFENLQSSQNRLPLDRADALNSALPNERDLGAFYYFTPVKRQELMEELMKTGMKHSGNYGMFALGFYNGQTANQPEKNDHVHVVSRLSYPFRLGSQILEPHVQAYAGRFTLLSISNGTKTTLDQEYDDQRAAAGVVLYPKPFGIQAEYNVGTSPGYLPEKDSIVQRDLRGGQITLCYRTEIGRQVLIPFVRVQEFNGPKKAELDARYHQVHEYEIGAEWLPFKNLELTAMYTISHRTTQDRAKVNNDQSGSLLRLQLQLNY